MGNRLMEKLHLQFWHKRGPSKRDALLVLMKTLELLSEALPIAMRHVAQENLETQEEFWSAFVEFRRRTDFSYHAAERFPTMERSRAIGELIEEWREVVECRVSTPSGDLDEEESEQGAAPETKA